jgi:flagellar hook assembly protein FlgD
MVSLKVYDMLGNEVRSLVSGESVTSGAHEVKWDGRDNSGSLVANGAYYYQLTTPEFTKIVKMQVIR